MACSGIFTAQYIAVFSGTPVTGSDKCCCYAGCCYHIVVFILLDEATASLDVDNETQIQEAISKLVSGKTVLVIAHRMRTIEAADQIVVLNKGVVAESGDHDTLMKKNGLYRKLVDLQTEAANWKLTSLMTMPIRHA